MTFVLWSIASCSSFSIGGALALNNFLPLRSEARVKGSKGAFAFSKTDIVRKGLFLDKYAVTSIHLSVTSACAGFKDKFSKSENAYFENAIPYNLSTAFGAGSFQQDQQALTSTESAYQEASHQCEGEISRTQEQSVCTASCALYSFAYTGSVSLHGGAIQVAEEREHA
jgi:hypothetical protein